MAKLKTNSLTRFDTILHRSYATGRKEEINGIPRGYVLNNLKTDHDIKVISRG